MPKEFADAVRLFEKLPERIGLPLLRKAGRKAVIPIQEEAERQAPVLTGKLRDNILIATKKESESQIQLAIGPAKSVFYGRFSEFGTAHEIARPWLEPAAEEKSEEAAAIFAAEFQRAITDHFQ